MAQNFPYFDPGDTAGPAAPFSYSEPPAYDPSTELREGDWTNEGLLKEVLKLLAPNLTRGDRPPLESAILDAGQFLPTPERGALLAKEGIPMAAGMVRSWTTGGKPKAFSKALFHRTLDPDELPRLEQIISEGLRHDVSGTFVTPTQAGTLRDASPYGVLMDIEHPQNIRLASGGDAYVGTEGIRGAGIPTRKIKDWNSPHVITSPNRYMAPEVPNELDGLMGNLQKMLKNQFGSYNEGVVSVDKTTPFKGISIIPHWAKNYDSPRETKLLNWGLNKDLPIYLMPSPQDIPFQELLDKLRNNPMAGEWAKGSYNGIPVIYPSPWAKLVGLKP